MPYTSYRCQNFGIQTPINTAMKPVHVLYLAVAMGFYGTSLAAQARPAAPVAVAAPPVVASRIKGPAPHLDGKLDDAAWSAASWTSDFTQREPTEGARATAETRVA